MEAYSATQNFNPHVDSYRPKSPKRANTPPSDQTHGNSSPRSVSFGRTSFKREEEKEKRQKYLTARYGQHQMMLIRKRLAVEDWLYEKLRDLYNCQNDEDDHDCQLDLEDILNLDTDNERLQYAYWISNTPRSMRDEQLVAWMKQSGCADVRNGSKPWKGAPAIAAIMLKETLTDAKQPPDLIHAFVTELIQKAKTL